MFVDCAARCCSVSNEPLDGGRAKACEMVSTLSPAANLKRDMQFVVKRFLGNGGWGQNANVACTKNYLRIFSCFFWKPSESPAIAP